MPQCPICHAAVWVGQRYCSTCDNYLPHPEEADHFCPRCGIRLAPQQKLCHKCKADLGQIAGTPPVTGSSGSLFTRALILLATGFAVLALIWLFLRHQKPEPPQLVVVPSPQAPSEQTPAAPPIPTAGTAPAAPTAPAAREPAFISEPTTPSPPKETTPTPSFPIYIVNTDDLALRDGPTTSAPQIATLNLNDEVELLETSGRWGRVRDVRRNIIGWSYMRYLTPREDGRSKGRSPGPVPLFELETYQLA
jgi:predicted RNA-binding Zn-ribbon protein involved in translation (DUF1610 family)